MTQLDPKQSSPDQPETVGLGEPPSASSVASLPVSLTAPSLVSPMSAAGVGGADAPMSFASAAVLLRRRVLDPPTHPGALANVDRFEVLRVVGTGGMGVVILARSPVG